MPFQHDRLSPEQRDIQWSNGQEQKAIRDEVRETLGAKEKQQGVIQWPKEEPRSLQLSEEAEQRETHSSKDEPEEIYTTAVYRKHYIPLESNPELFTQLIHKLGVSTSLAFQDVLSIDDPDLLAFIPRPVLALVLVFPTSDSYESQKTKEEALVQPCHGSGKDENVIWFKQTINNACGLYGILHSVSNGDARFYIKHILKQPSKPRCAMTLTSKLESDSPLAKLLASCLPLAPGSRARLLEDSDELESAYREVALQGDSNVPENAEDEVDFHYTCFVKSHKDGHLYEMDGDRKGPVDWGSMEGEYDLLSERGLRLIRKFIDREGGQNMNFSLLALVLN